MPKNRYTRHEVSKEDLGSLPVSCGVYLFKNSQGQIIYIGKAINIVKRVKSHLAKSNTVYRKNMVAEIHSIATILTHDEHEALVLEEELIKTNRPRYNLRLRDDKSYPYICFVPEVQYPAVLFTRKKTTRNGLFFGPYTDSRKAREGLKCLRSIFQIRGCTQPEDRFPLARPCLDHELGLCSAPCIGRIAIEDYRENLHNAYAFLRGDFKRVEEHVEQEMWTAAKNLDFEKAASLRGRLKAVRNIMVRYRLVLEDAIDVDFIEAGFQEGLAGVTVLRVRQGCLVSSENYLVTLEGQPEQPDLIGEFVDSVYLPAGYVPPRVVVSAADQPELYRLREDLPLSLEISVPNGERELGLLAFARENLEKTLRGEHQHMLRNETAREQLLLKAKNVLDLPTLPRIVDGVDISTFQGSETVGVVVSFGDGLPVKRRYRKFILPGLDAPDDYRAMEMVLIRYFRQLLAQKRDLPDLLLVDGGPGQLGSACCALQKTGIDIPLVALAKEIEALYIPSRRKPLRLPEHSEVLMFLQRVRDEAHRFAVHFHRYRRNRHLYTGILDSITGIGPVRKQRLLGAFSDLAELAGADPGQTSRNLRIPRRVVEEIQSRLRNRIEE